jgi:hypothetical protein
MINGTGNFSPDSRVIGAKNGPSPFLGMTDAKRKRGSVHERKVSRAMIPPPARPMYFSCVLSRAAIRAIVDSSARESAPPRFLRQTRANYISAIADALTLSPRNA